MYLATQKSYWSLQEANLSPGCIFTPDNPQDVSEAVSILSNIDDCRFAIKGRTHAPAAGFANINAGVTIDMTNLNLITINPDHTVACIGGGTSWLEVYQYLDTLGVSVAGGRNGAVGVGGLTLGGGISYFTPRTGFTCDTVVNFEIVLPSGKLANVNASSRPDLFRALKGGANNFGIITRFDLAAFPQEEVFAGTFVQAVSNREAVFKAFANIAAAPEYDPYTSLVTGLIFNSMSKTWIISSAAIYTKPDLSPSVYQELRSIPTIANATRLTNLSTLAAEAPTPPLNWLFSTGTYNVSVALLVEIFDTLNATIHNFDVPGGISWSIAFEPLPTLATQYGDLRGGNSLGTSPRDGNAFIMLLAGLWPDTASNARVGQTARGMQKAVDEVARRMGMLHEFRYLNYADPSQDPLGSYGEENVERLMVVSRRYDPRGVFQRMVPGGFKLWGRRV